MHLLSSAALLVASTLISSSSAHVRLGTMIPGYGRLQNFDPLLNRSPLNSFEQGNTNPDSSKVAFCKGLQSGGVNGKPTTLKTGSNQFDLDLDQAPHGGGSMQVSLSFDGGKSFKVLKSFIGGFPRNKGGNDIDPNQTYNFSIPSDTLAGPAIFSWSWSNLLGNREWYNDCAPVVISSGSGTSKLENLPDMFVSNIPSLGPCTNDENVNVEYPEPGSVVERNGSSGPPHCPASSTGGTVNPAAPPPSSSSSTSAPPPPSTSGTPPTDPSSSSQTVSVQAGDTCQSIADANGVTVQDIMSNNPSVNSGCTNLEIGQVINLGPTATGAKRMCKRRRR